MCAVVRRITFSEQYPVCLTSCLYSLVSEQLWLNFDKSFSTALPLSLRNLFGVCSQVADAVCWGQDKPPRVRFTTEVFHPNVYSDGTLCMCAWPSPFLGVDPQ